MTDRFYTVAGENRVRIAVGACRFIASVARTDTENNARDYIRRVSGEFRDPMGNWAQYFGRRLLSAKWTMCSMEQSR